MRKSLIIACASLAACVCFADPAYVVSIPMGTNTSQVVEFPRIMKGSIESVYIAAVGGVVTGNVGLVYAPHHGVTDQQTILATNYTVTGKAVVRPRVTGQTTAGANLASAYQGGTNTVATTVLSVPYEPIYLAGESVSVVVSDSPTNVTWRVVLVVK
jgi:hypothetical protein